MSGSVLPVPPPVHTGKVRDLYAPTDRAGEIRSIELYPAGEDFRIMVASDRVSAFDVVLESRVPDKGKILTQLSLWWFEKLDGLVPNHLISSDVNEYPEPFNTREDWLGRSMLVKRLNMIKIECVARAYLSGSALSQYRCTQAVCGISLPPGLVEGSKLPEPIFTPTTKAESTGHDEPLSYHDLMSNVGQQTASELRRLTLAILERGRSICEPRGIIVADTKVEFGVDPKTGALVLADEVLTPDSSRFWDAQGYKPGQAQPSFDKQPLRDWLEASSWDKQPPGPELPPHVVNETRERYVAAFEKITELHWPHVASVRMNKS